LRAGEVVQKCGRTTGTTTGVVVAVAATVFVDYWTLGIAGARTEFVEQIITSRMSSYGDSGSLLVDLKDRALGMLFAGSATHSYYNPMLEVTNAFQLGV
jgi:hypothetical protein